MQANVMYLVLAVLFLSACSEEEQEQLAGADKEYVEQTNAYRDYAKGAMGPDGMYRSTDGSFLAAFPKEPEHTVDFVDTEVGKVRMDMFVYNESATQSFMVSISEFPTKHVQNEGARQLLGHAYRGALNTLKNYSIYEDQDFELNSMPAKRLKVASDDWHVSAEMFMVGNRLYQATILRDGALPAKEVEDAFLGKFHIMKEGEQQF